LPAFIWFIGVKIFKQFITQKQFTRYIMKHIILSFFLTLFGSTLAQLQSDLNNQVDQTSPVVVRNTGENSNATFDYDVTATTDNIIWHYNPPLSTGSDLLWRITMRAKIATPYVTVAGGAIPLELTSTEIIGQEFNIEPWRNPKPYPVVIFGNGGAYTNFYSNEFPYESNFSLSNPSDQFYGNEETVALVGNQNNLWGEWGDWFLDFIFSYIGIPRPPHGAPLWLGGGNNPREFKLQSYIWVNGLTGPKGAFWHDGNIGLADVQITAGEYPGELGSCNINLPLEGAYVYISDVTGLARMEFVKTLPTLNLKLYYVRGDHLLVPKSQMSSGAYQLNIGDTTTITVTVNNNSQVLRLKGGYVSLDISSLLGRLIVLSAATINIDSIDVNSSKDFNFLVEAVANGVISPQADVQVGWGWPAPSILTNPIDIPASIDSNYIIVGNPTGIDDNIETTGILDFVLYKNYPNPFNPTTTIKYQLPENKFVSIKVYDVLGEEVASIINEEKSAGSYEVNFNAGKLSSGIYFYTLQAGSFVETKKMVLLR
jgi:hypothetical protein